jgi:nitrite reductase/ring-hydroxylating ferredoxin subunit/uncharacterized membrane protein
LHVSGTPTAPSPLLPLVEALERAEPLDPPGEAIAKTVRGAIGPGTLRDLLAGTWLGHALHPLLTDVVIGSWTSATLLDLIGGDDSGDAAARLIAVGIAAYPVTAVTGVSDWADAEPADPRVRRVGLVHAASNTTALGLYTASLAARRNGARGRGRLLALAGAGVLAAAGYLGAHLTFARGVGPNQTAFDPGPTEWTPSIDAADLPPDEARSCVVGETPVLLLRHGDGVHAMHNRCSHRGCMLSDGEVDGEIVTCACHGSQFDLRDGSVQRGPATAPQPVYQARESGGRIEIRLAS